MTIFATLCLLLTPLNLVLGFWVYRLSPRQALNRVLAVSFTVTAAWTLAAAFANTATDPGTFWLALRIGLSCYLVLTPLSVAILLVFTRASRGWLVFLVGAASAVTVTLLAVNWTGPFVYGGFHPTPWGNAVEPLAGSPWGALDAGVDGILWLTTLGFLVRAWARSRSHRYRNLAVLYLGFTIVMKLASTFAVVVVAQVWGFPEPSVLFSAPILVFYFFLIDRYQHLTAERPNLEGPLFQSMQDLILVTDGQGNVLKAGASVARVLTVSPEALEGRPLADLLVGWPDLAAHLAAVTRDHQPKTGLEGTVGAGRFLLDLTPIHDKFRDGNGVLVRLQPQNEVDPTLFRYGISPREREVAVLVGEGLTTQEIGEALFISPATVKNHLYNLYQKTGATNRVELGRALRPQPAG